jgi:membrane protease YdiL (CAAX protease family)
MAKPQKASRPAGRDLEDFAVAVAIFGGLSSQLPRLLPQENADLAKLLWLSGPVLVAAVIITRGGWWRRVGFSFPPKTASLWSLVALTFPVVLGGALLTLSEKAGAAEVKETSYAELIAFAAPMAGMLLVKNIFEEFLFRGYFTSRSQESRFCGISAHLLTGVVWAVWHLPYWLVFLGPEKVESFGGMPLSYFITLAFLSLPLQSIFYGELRLISGSLLPPYLFHVVTNLITLSLIEGEFVVPEGFGGALLAPASHGILYTVILAGIGLLMMQARLGHLVWDSPDKRDAPETTSASDKTDTPVTKSGKAKKKASSSSAPDTATKHEHSDSQL